MLASCSRPQDGPLNASKFSGAPFLPSGSKWPACQNCGKPMQLFLQLNPSELPEQVTSPWGEGLLQFFYCTNSEPLCEVDCEAFFPFSKSTLLRIVSAEGKSEAVDSSAVLNGFPPKLIVGWKVDHDLPNWEELRSLGVELTDEESEELSEKGFPRSGEKLLGWPAWVQGVEYPQCPECGSQMRLVFQIDSSGHLPYMFGDVGCGHISQCAIHPSNLAFGWACG
ncbi:DUF1963 domain-containing protein [Stenotrophobium rhamnosiphilum]|uniref:DUF1963 domain-containing protein n=1 Tax=Stenotrophobium rhamnosiphilum TaxID=2029166 RepID=UPI0023E8212B|nr:DUF1963 domain-containing protein [Stenotrophobium rhamnosiphilum]